MQWDDSPAGGFTTPGARTWLPVGDVKACNVAAQREDPASVLSFCRELLRLRRARAHQGLPVYERLPGPAGVWRYTVGELTVTANFTDKPVMLAPRPGRVLLSTAGDSRQSSRNARTAGERNQALPATLAPWEGVISS